MKTFVFAAKEPRIFRFRPGQFMTFDLPIGAGLSRCYTISASAARPYRISITVKRVPGGAASNWLHDTLVAGSTLRAFGPMGEFTADAAAPGKLLFLAGGSGITPLMSMIRTACDLSEPQDVVLVNAARTPKDIIFRNELSLLAAPSPGLRVRHVCETAGADDDWTGLTGRLSLPMLALVAPDFRERTVYCCGPAPFMAAARDMLAGAGFDMARYFEESFDLSANVPDVPAKPGPDEAGEATFRVAFLKSGQTVACPPGLTLLDAAREAGLRLPSSCHRGFCGTCKSRLVSGEVDMVHAGGIRQREIAQGLILPCCSRPLSDIELDA